jgi:hypothetical protein
MGTVSLNNRGGAATASTSPGGFSSVTVNGQTKNSGGSQTETAPAIKAAGKSMTEAPPPAAAPSRAKLEALGKSIADTAIATGQTSGISDQIKQAVASFGTTGTGKASALKQIEALQKELGAESGSGGKGGLEAIVQNISAELSRLKTQVAQLMGGA